MARVLLIIALFMIPGLVSASRPVGNPFKVQGKVFCDTCRAGFETSVTTYITGAKVRIECKDRRTMKLVYSKDATTDHTGTYTIWVSEDHEDQVCDATLVSSPQKDCTAVSKGRDRARVILTRNNGIASDNRAANAMGFMKDEALLGCNNILKQYLEYEE